MTTYTATERADILDRFRRFEDALDRLAGSNGKDH